MESRIIGMNKHSSQFEDFLTPKILKEKLVIASLFIALYDNMKESLVEKLKYFYFDGIERRKQETVRVVELILAYTLLVCIPHKMHCCDGCTNC